MALPDRRFRGTRSGRPIMVLLDLIGRRWALRVLWELRDGALTFRDLQARCDAMSPSVLNRRLAELKDALLVETGDDGYRLAVHGRELLRRFAPLSQWAEAWAQDLPGARR